jgi:rubredoxin
LDTAREIGANQIVLGGRKRSTLGALVFGSVSQDVTLNATQPVTITGGVEDLERPSHRCANCGETYYTNPEIDIPKCQNCGGVNVEQIPDESTETHSGE